MPASHIFAKKQTKAQTGSIFLRCNCDTAFAVRPQDFCSEGAGKAQEKTNRNGAYIDWCFAASSLETAGNIDTPLVARGQEFNDMISSQQYHKANDMPVITM